MTRLRSRSPAICSVIAHALASRCGSEDVASRNCYANRTPEAQRFETSTYFPQLVESLHFALFQRLPVASDIQRPQGLIPTSTTRWTIPFGLDWTQNPLWETCISSRTANLHSDCDSATTWRLRSAKIADRFQLKTGARLRGAFGKAFSPTSLHFACR